ncbi:conserved hypothetical protein [Photobacterium leiognathi lrivu.4.1]|uniref:Uncharacterized protein n=1 Tax=Photobacterium leiognathi lrivu.4.1 TaxID=1248232 RepID=A0A0U1P5R2_PHOLE|nr:conserved hypothetical protein [Photobacterium leiognathi lrivu.4.1]
MFMDYQSIRHLCENRQRLNTLIETKRNRYNLLLKRSRTLKQQIQYIDEQLITNINTPRIPSPSVSSQQNAAEIFQETLRQQWKKKQQLLHIETTIATHAKSIERIEVLVAETTNTLRAYKRQVANREAIDVQLLLQLNQLEIKLLLTLESYNIDANVSR